MTDESSAGAAAAEDHPCGHPLIALGSRKFPLSSLMRRGTIWAPTLLLLLAYLILHALFLESRAVRKIGAATVKSNLNLLLHNQQQQQQQHLVSLNNLKPKLRIYMHELPRKFTYGVVENYLKARRLYRKGGEVKYPGNQHSAEWWLFLDLFQEGERLSDPTTVRVWDPDSADVFYVPFFSSLSLMAGSGKKGDAGEYSDEEMQEELMQWLESQEVWVRNGGRDHVVVCQDPNALYKLRSRLQNSVLLLSDFGRFRPGEASLVKDVVLPYSHRINTYVAENVTVERSTLLFFMGNRYRKEGGKIRDQLFQVLEGERDMVIKHGTQSREGRRAAASGMRNSRFCLHPAGDTPSACRLFDAIVSVCVPVIVSDEIELPFEDVLDYSEFSVFVPAVKALEPGYLGSYLRNMSGESVQQMQQRLREVRQYFEYEVKGGAVEMIWQQVRNKLPMMRAMINRDRRVVLERSSGNNCSCTHIP